MSVHLSVCLFQHKPAAPDATAANFAAVGAVGGIYRSTWAFIEKTCATAQKSSRVFLDFEKNAKNIKNSVRKVSQAT